MWARRLLFGLVCVVGLGALVAGMLYGDANRNPTPPDDRFASYDEGDFRQVVDRVNAEFAELGKSGGFTATSRAPDLTIVRRLSLGLTGTVPSLEEIRQFEAARPEHVEQWWLSHLFADRRYSDYVAERLARAYVGVEGGPFLLYRRRRFVLWLSRPTARQCPLRPDRAAYDLRLGLVDRHAGDQFRHRDLQAEDRGGQPDPVRLAGRSHRARSWACGSTACNATTTTWAVPGSSPTSTSWPPSSPRPFLA